MDKKKGLLTAYRRLVLMLKKKHLYKKYVDNCMCYHFPYRFGCDHSDRLTVSGKYGMMERQVMRLYGYMTDENYSWDAEMDQLIFFDKFYEENVSFYWNGSPEGFKFWCDANAILAEIYIKMTYNE